MVALGGPVAGFIEPSAGDFAVSQLIEFAEIHHFVRNGDFAPAAGLRPTSTPGAPPLTTRGPLPNGR